MKLLLILQQQQLLLVLLLLLLQYNSAQEYHREVYVTACSDADRADMYTLDGEVMFYSDFDKQVEVYTLPEFADPVKCPGSHDLAVINQGVCQGNLQSARKATKDVPPELDPPGAPLLYPEDHLRPSHPNTLVCQASGFYPAPVHFSWTKDGHNMTRSASVSQAYPQSDGTFTQFSRLDMSPEEGQVYSCALEHPALKGAQRSRLWTVEFLRPSLAPSVFCAVGLSLGLVGVAVGTFFLVKGRQCCCDGQPTFS
ncbi:H-2 class II histocompatibility antigen, A-U alpha chain-like [Periophthalmus magnuspinnatus]|uniref:H-2 class II histocompatibility antigen, A-U alpha chain-like n=1 Tax=Periophthalmus magnuspinnatus TaxID=409849 RepID=UPI0024369D44|nr:H-2 class II histocompatibility antigen, A-U alpha chain-like [Periophthalmus magnuspinnatus]